VEAAVLEEDVLAGDEAVGAVEKASARVRTGAEGPALSTQVSPLGVTRRWRS
jgi:hypothetical protein